MYIGRFQPPHAAHLGTMQRALVRHGRLLVLLGSANLARSVNNPWTPPERARLIRASLAAQGTDTSGLVLRSIPDEFDAARWAAHVRAAVQATLRRTGAAAVVLTGFEKDASSAYLRWFPEWTREPVPACGTLNATAVRAVLLGEGRVPGDLPGPVADHLRAFLHTPLWRRLRAEFQAVQAERTALTDQGAPTPRHELLQLHLDRRGPGAQARVWLRRRAGPTGAGLLSLPGRVLQVGETPPAAASPFAHPARSLVWPATAHVVTVAAPPPGSRPVLLDSALRRPRAFFEDHHVILRRLCTGGVTPGRYPEA